MTNLLICSYLEPEHIATIKRVSQKVNVQYHPELLPPPRYQADHAGAAGFQRNPAQQAQWQALLNEAEVMFDFDYSGLEHLHEHAHKVRWIQASSAGIGQLVKRLALHRLGATLTTAAGVHARPLAEFVLWAMLAFAKNYPLARQQQRAQHWERFHNDDLEGKTLAVVGLGSIGREVARLARAMGLHVIGSKRSIEGLQPADVDVSALYALSDLQAMLAQADYVCLICPHTPETEGMMDAAAFAAMKPGSVFINIGRGALVQEEALLQALEQGPMQGAVLDVTSPEPLPPGHPLWEKDNVIIFPHSASTSRNENRRLVALFCDNLQRYLTGEPLRNVFDIDRLY